MLTLTKSDQPSKRGNPAWRKGVSANPAGRRAEQAKYVGQSVQELARLHTHEAVRTLVIALHHPRERVTAAIALLDRGWGKPQQNVHMQSEQTVLHLIAAQAISQELQALAQPVPAIEHQAGDGSDGQPTE